MELLSCLSLISLFYDAFWYFSQYSISSYLLYITFSLGISVPHIRQIFSAFKTNSEFHKFHSTALSVEPSNLSLTVLKPWPKKSKCLLIVIIRPFVSDASHQHWLLFDSTQCLLAVLITYSWIFYSQLAINYVFCSTDRRSSIVTVRPWEEKISSLEVFRRICSTRPV